MKNNKKQRELELMLAKERLANLYYSPTLKSDLKVNIPKIISDFGFSLFRVKDQKPYMDMNNNYVFVNLKECPETDSSYLSCIDNLILYSESINKPDFQILQENLDMKSGNNIIDYSMFACPLISLKGLKIPTDENLFLEKVYDIAIDRRISPDIMMTRLIAYETYGIDP